ncbi:MAG: MATE family efflux transporter, partial [Lachnospiraceae bacterium]|nr:MATE family efflux transporter [Lachnospiraceae bacterium]
MAAKKYSMNMTEGALLPKIISFTLPLIASSVLQLLFNAADMIVAGRYVGANALAAIGSTSALINLLVNLFIGLAVGGNVLVARFFGSGREKDVSETVHTAILLSLTSGAFLALFGYITAPKLLLIMGTPTEVLNLASLYIRIYFMGMPVMMLYNFGSAILRAIGDTKRPLFFLTIAGVVNVICNVTFIVFLKRGVDGVAMATVLSQALSAFLVIGCLIKTDECYKVEVRKLRFSLDKLFQILRLGIPAGIQGCLFSFSNVLIQSSVNSFGAETMAGNSAASNIEGFVYVIMNAFHHTALSFTSQNYGAKNFERIKKVCLNCMILVTISGLLSGFIAYTFGPQLLSLYANSADREIVVRYGMTRMSIIMLTYFTCGTMDCMVGCIRGLGYSVMPTIVSLLGACGFRILWIFTIFANMHTLECLYVSYPISWIITTTTHIICFITVFRKT